MAVEPSMSVKRKVTVPVGTLDLLLLVFLTVLLPDVPSVTLWSLSPPRAEGAALYAPDPDFHLEPMITDIPHLQKMPRSHTPTVVK
jgi:hypothetical protein